MKNVSVILMMMIISITSCSKKKECKFYNEKKDEIYPWIYQAEIDYNNSPTKKNELRLERLKWQMEQYDRGIENNCKN